MSAKHQAKLLAKKLSQMPPAAGLSVGVFFVATDTGQLFVTANPAGTGVQWLALGGISAGTFTMKASSHIDALHVVSFTGDHVVGYGLPGMRAAGVAQNSADPGQDVVVAHSGLLVATSGSAIAPLDALKIDGNGKLVVATPLTVDTSSAPDAHKPTQGSVIVAEAVGAVTGADEPLAIFWGLPSGGLPRLAA